MSLIKRLNTNAELETSLRQKLAQEFIQPSSGYVQPLIEIETQNSKTHLLVVWDDWKFLSQQERSAIILNAYEDATNTAAALEVSVAMGLTQTEAKHLGFDFEEA